MAAGVTQEVSGAPEALLAALERALSPGRAPATGDGRDALTARRGERRSALRPGPDAESSGLPASPRRLALLTRRADAGPSPLARSLRERALSLGAVVLFVPCGAADAATPHGTARALLAALAREGDPGGRLAALLARLDEPTTDPAAESRRRIGLAVRALTRSAEARPLLVLADGLEAAAEETVELLAALVRAAQAPEGPVPALFLALSARRGGEAAFAELAREAGGPRGAIELDDPRAPSPATGPEAAPGARPPQARAGSAAPRSAAPASTLADAERAWAQAAPRTARRILRAALAREGAPRGGKSPRSRAGSTAAPGAGLHDLLGRTALDLALDLPASAPERRALALEAAAALDEALAQSLRRGDRAAEAHLALQQGRAYRLAQRDEPSRAALARAIDLAEALREPRLQALVLGARAEAALGKGASAAAVSLAERAKERLLRVHAAAPPAQHAPLARELSQAEGILARALLAAGDPARARDHARGALSLAIEAQDQGAALEAHLTIADASLALARRGESPWDAAEAAAAEAVASAREAGDERSLARALERRARAVPLGAPWTALRDAHTESLAAARRSGERHRVARATAALAEEALAHGDAEAAVTSANEAATLENPLAGGRAQVAPAAADASPEDAQDPGQTRRGTSYARALLLLGRSFLAAGRPERSLACAARARALAAKAQDAGISSQAERVLADARALAGALGDPDAVRAFEEANPRAAAARSGGALEDVSSAAASASAPPPAARTAPTSAPAAAEGASLSRWRYARIVGLSEPMERLYALLDRIGDSPAPVLISGESGTGKELVARSVHEGGARRFLPFLSINCAALPEALLESELFGHVKGAFTGADGDKTGLFEAAGHGTLFLDEVGETSPGMQAKLLRVLQEREVRRVGGTGHVRVEARIIAASNRDLARMTEAGQFRPDLFYRLNVISVALPPLRERREDVPLLVEHFLRRFAAERGGPPAELGPGVLEALTAAPWPGNVRELENEIRRAVTLAHGTIGLADLSPRLQGLAPGDDGAVGGDRGALTLRERLEIAERRVLKDALARNGGNKTRTAQELGLSRFGLLKKLDKYGLR